MTVRLISLFALLTFYGFAHAETWEEKCPIFKVEPPYRYGTMYGDNGWTNRDMGNQGSTISCANWKVFTGEMACFYGPAHINYTKAVKKVIPAGVTCERAGQCKFKCSKASSPPAVDKNIRLPKKNLRLKLE